MCVCVHLCVCVFVFVRGGRCVQMCVVAMCVAYTQSIVYALELNDTLIDMVIVFFNHIYMPLPLYYQNTYTIYYI